jgi:hypothetical protein
MAYTLFAFLLVVSWATLGATASYILVLKGEQRITLQTLFVSLFTFVLGPIAWIGFFITCGDHIVLWEAKPKDDADSSKSGANKP